MENYYDQPAKTLEDIALMCLRSLNPSQRAQLRTSSPGALHMGLGMFVRNKFIYSNRYRIVGASTRCMFHPDHMSTEILRIAVTLLAQEWPLATSSNPAVRSRMVTLEQARRAIYIDFEGNVDAPPVLLGTHCEDSESTGRMEHIVHDPTFWPLTAEAQSPSVAAQSVVAATLVDTLAAVQHRAITENRRVISWSRREADAIRASGCSDETLHFFEEHLVDAKVIAKNWKRRAHPGHRWSRLPRVGIHTLDRYMALVGYAVPTAHRPGKTGTRLRSIRTRLDSGKPLTRGLRAHWTKLLNHNFHDCRGMRAVTITALGG